MKKPILKQITLQVLLLYTLINVFSMTLIGVGKGNLGWLTLVETLTALIFALLHAGQSLGWRKAVLLVMIAFGVSLALESAGVATGWIYGPYHYTERLGPKFLGLVPWIIPAAWIMMIYPALVIADLIVPKFDKRVLRMILVGGVGGFAMTAWDLTMDPVMVLGQNWVWEKPGNYFGIPIQNYFGWFVTVLFILVIYQWLSAFFPKRSEEEEIPALWAVQSYGVTALSTVMIAFFINLTGPALVGIFAMLPWLAWGMWAAAAKRREYAGKG